LTRLDRAIQYAAASPFITNASGILDHPLFAGDDGSAGDDCLLPD